MSPNPYAPPQLDQPPNDRQVRKPGVWQRVLFLSVPTVAEMAIAFGLGSLNGGRIRSRFPQWRSHSVSVPSMAVAFGLGSLNGGHWFMAAVCFGLALVSLWLAWGWLR